MHCALSCVASKVYYVRLGHSAVVFVYFSCFFFFTQSVVSSQRLVMQERRERNHGKKMETPLVFDGQ